MAPYYRKCSTALSSLMSLPNFVIILSHLIKLNVYSCYFSFLCLLVSFLFFSLFRRNVPRILSSIFEQETLPSCTDQEGKPFSAGDCFLLFVVCPASPLFLSSCSCGGGLYSKQNSWNTYDGYRLIYVILTC
jgi:hypothetical protein